jgi:hypothetical protein
MNEQDGFRLEAAEQFGFSQAEDDGPYTCTEAQLIAFAKAAERKGMASAAALIRNRAQTSALRSSCDDLILAAREIESLVAVSDAELAPILAAEEERYMTAQGYVRGTCGKMFGTLNINDELLA